jgi:hypothetical protein
MMNLPLLCRALKWGKRRDRHQARYLSPSAFYSFCFSLPDGTNVFDLSESLLRADIARFAMNPQGEELRLAHRFKKLMETRTAAESLVEWREVESGERSLLAWATRHPRIGGSILLRSFLAILRTLVGRRPKTVSKDGDAEVASAPDRARETVEFIDEAMANARLTLGIRDEIDRKFYTSAYLEEVPFVRLELEPTYVSSARFEEEPFIVDLLLHQSGAAILSFGDCD